MASSAPNPNRVFWLTFFIVLVVSASFAVLPMVMLPNLIAPAYTFMCPDGWQAQIEVSKYSQPGSVSYTPHFSCVSGDGRSEPMREGNALLATLMYGAGFAFITAAFYSFIAWWRKENMMDDGFDRTGKGKPKRTRLGSTPNSPVTYSKSTVNTKIIVDGKEYARVEDMPFKVRKSYEQAMEALAKSDIKGIEDVLQGISLSSLLSATSPDDINTTVNTKIFIDGKEYTSMDQLPPKEQEGYTKAMQLFVDKDGDGIPDIFQHSGRTQVISVFGQADPQEKLEKLKILLDAGLITQQDFDDKKADILSQM